MKPKNHRFSLKKKKETRDKKFGAVLLDSLIPPQTAIGKIIFGTLWAKLRNLGSELCHRTAVPIVMPPIR